MNSIRFDGRVAIVTGAGNGLGRDYALALAARGAAVVVNELGCDGAGRGSSREAADATVEAIRTAGGRAVASYESVATRAGGESIVATAVKAFGRVDIVINNAGFLRNARFEALDEPALDAILDTHLKGAFHVTQPAYRLMKDQRYGRVLFTSSASGMFGSPHQSNYGAAKAGLVGLMNCLALEGKAFGILANALLPTARTRLIHEMSEEWVQEAQLSPDMGLIESTGSPSFVTPLVLYLVSERCTATHNLYSAIGGRFARAFIGVTEGWQGPLDAPASPEDIEKHFATVENRERYYIPWSVTDEFTPVLQAVKKVRR